ncbi:hypothetical protein MAPG_07668 [Magnaporthiopsis poae ATCC 64411]|uniref:Autophagy-related protein 28 n=1 Tax=Magnaporthiopsis poae (strain ATCC 64411 / 73-15) TaxID=644358 RepID=A0A0C4E5A2_MAGP6|nr:hypothetical protein MAPG_07668 [Magnaporthiopsis poae ATCC 64411]
MAYKSSFFPRLGLSKDVPPLLPFHTSSDATNPPLRAKRSEYDMSELSPRSDPYSSPPASHEPYADHPDARSDTENLDMASPSTPTRPKSGQRVLFAGPPPPIVTSTLLYRDLEGGGPAPVVNRQRDRFSASQAIGSVLFSRGGGSSSARDRSPQYEADSAWQSFARREKALQRDAQNLLDVQAAGLSAGLGRVPKGTPSATSSDAAASDIFSGSSRASSAGRHSPRRDSQGHQHPLSQSRIDPPIRSNANGGVMPLRALELDDEDPLAQELRGLQGEHEDVCAQISELEERLAARCGPERLPRTALKEVDAQIAALLRRPPVLPLDVAALAAASGGTIPDDASPGGLEFLRLHPERRTIGMATDWWSKEVEILEQRKSAVDRERQALEEGVEVWRQAVKLVSDFEAGLRKHMTVDDKKVDNGAEPDAPDPFSLQLKKMQAVIAGLDDLLQTVERKGWNLLICAIGAELEAFREAFVMLREALTWVETDEDTPRLARSAVETESTANRQKRDTQVGEKDGQEEAKEDEGKGHGALLDLQDNHRLDQANDTGNSDKDAAAAHAHAAIRGGQAQQRHTDGDSVPSLDRDDSENEIPPEFLMEHAT